MSISAGGAPARSIAATLNSHGRLAVRLLAHHGHLLRLSGERWRSPRSPSARLRSTNDGAIGSLLAAGLVSITEPGPTRGGLKYRRACFTALGSEVAQALAAISLEDANRASPARALP